MSRKDEKNINTAFGIQKDTGSIAGNLRGWYVPWDDISCLNWKRMEHLQLQNKGKAGCYVDHGHVTLVGAGENQIRDCISMCGDNLQILDLSYSTIREIPEEVHNLRSLRYLGLQGLFLDDLPVWLSEVSEKFSVDRYDTDAGINKAVVNLCDTVVNGVDMSIFEQPHEMVVKWFVERVRIDIDPLDEIKVVFLGDGEVGKSLLIERLMHDGAIPMDYDGISTPGIAIRKKQYDLAGRRIQANFWDFGGQEIMHSMHRIFMTSRALYVVVLNARDDTQEDRARYWLQNIRSFAADAPVILILNKNDQNPNARININALHQQFGNLKRYVSMSALKMSAPTFNSEFTAMLLEEIHRTGFLEIQWPASWRRLKQTLENMDSAYIRGDTYEKLCRESGVEVNRKELLHWFNDLGVSFSLADEDDYALSDYIVLRPDWITNALYIILFNRIEGACNGLIPHKSIYNLLKSARDNPAIRCTLPQARYNTGDIGYVLGVMRKFNLSFPHGTEHEFIPMLCQRDSTVDIKKDYQDADTLEFDMEFDYLPNNLLHRLMVERYDELDMENVWRTGARLEFKELGYSAVVTIDGNTLRLFIRHNDPMHRPNTYLTILKAHVDRIVANMGLKPPVDYLIYKINGKSAQFRYDRLLKMYKRGFKEEYCVELDEDFLIEDILNQSAPDGLGDEKKLLDAITRSCCNIQDEPVYRLIRKKDGSGYVNGLGMEDFRNRRIRDNLINIGYRISDQTQRGFSGTGKNVGELDMLVYNDSNEPWTIIEALHSSTSTRLWDQHLNKLLLHYNSWGLSPLFLICYVDCDTEAWPNLWRRISEHTRYYSPDRCELIAGSYEELHDMSGQSPYLRIVKCDYICGAETTTVYHYFVRVEVAQ